MAKSKCPIKNGLKIDAMDDSKQKLPSASNWCPSGMKKELQLLDIKGFES